MFYFYLVISLLIPAVMIGIGLLWAKRPPKKINFVYGYRTCRSMKSQQTWNFAHVYFCRFWIYMGIIFAFLSAILLLVFRNSGEDILANISLIITGIQVVGLLLPVIPTELALKKHFDEDGKPKLL